MEFLLRFQDAMNMHLDFIKGQQISYSPNLTKTVICFSSLIPVCDTENAAHSRLRREVYGQIHQ